MKIKYLLLVVTLIVPPFLFLSCSASDEAENRIEAAKIVESRSSEDLLNDLYLASDGNIESLSRILQVTPSSINRLRNGKTVATAKFEEKVKTVAIYYYQNDRRFSLVQSALDEEYGWYDSILNFPSHHPWIFWIVNIVLFLLLVIIKYIYMLYPFIAEMFIFLIAWIVSLICTPGPISDNFTNSINPTIEQIL
ncbi:hypothetical protein [Hoylesella buccalis]|uniref:Lipoprotein n=1 Tax=Hoylesella buccalis DNF00853 TaxID=1401074 RepID=A0A096BT26_9BACT|nr:hypothetical protein [Hoylesella buccalis]KGF36319.1 hypothetical protein HMPREF2137_02415 [Hoylesella buccalis DNF00853]